MNKNAEKIGAWRQANPGTTLNGSLLRELLSLADLTGANLTDADLRGADLWGGMPISTPSGEGYLIPTPDGWHITIGCWRNHTLDDLRALIEDRAEWPEATGTLRERRRPILAAVLTIAEAHTEYHADIVQTLAKKWSTK